MVLSPTSTPLCCRHASIRSTARTSGFASRWARSQSRSTRRGLLPPLGFDWTSPVSRKRRNHRLTVASPTANSSAVAAYVPLRFAR